MERFEDAERYLSDAVEAFRIVFDDPHHPETLNAMNNHANVLRTLERLEQAEAIGAEVVRLAMASLPADDHHLGFYLHDYARTLVQLQRFVEAEFCLLESYRIHETHFGPEHPRTVGLVTNLSEFYQAWHEAEPYGGYDTRHLKWVELD